MLKNYFKTAWRNFVNNKFYASLNIIGLTVGLAVGMLIILWVNDERSYDKFHSKADQLYRVNTQLGTGISKGVYGVTQATIAFHALKEVPGVQNAVRVTENGDYAIFTYRDKTLKEDRLIYTDPAVFKMFDYNLLKGDPDNPFPDDHSIIITQSTARRFFGEADPIGKVLLADNKENFVVNGVVADFPGNTSLKCEILFSTGLYNQRYANNEHRKSMDEDWGNYAWTTYLQIQPGVPVSSVAAKLTEINIKHQSGLSPVDVGSYVLQPLTQTHLFAPDGSSAGMQTVKIFTIVAILILLIASINYINLSTARAMLRSKEVSIRKMIGAGRGQLIAQFIIETVLFFVLALFLAFGLIVLLMPLYNNIAGKQMHFDLFNTNLWILISITVLTTLVASGIYPALLLSSFKPMNALKGKLSLGIANTTSRKILVVCQFAFSIGLIIGTIIINRQLNYIRHKDLGYDKSHVFSFPMREMGKHYEAAKAELLKQPGIEGVTTANRNIVNVPGSTLDINWDGKDPNQSYFIHAMGIDKDFLSMFKLKMVEGIDFSGLPADSVHFILNETAVKEAGLKDPVGKRLTFSGTKGMIIGVVKDFHFVSLRETIQPFLFYYKPVNGRMFVRTTGKNAPDAIKAVERLWKQYNTNFPLEYTFLDAVYDRHYRTDQQISVLFDAFTGIAILISCLGLFGLATYSANIKVKEIGIRKVLGASVLNITAMLSRDFIVLVLLSIVIATPVAWWAMNNWLMNFAYRAGIQWWIFVVAGLSALVITLFTVSFQSVRAALANPVDSLRKE